jgi:hypothetical protein
LLSCIPDLTFFVYAKLADKKIILVLMVQCYIV